MKPKEKYQQYLSEAFGGANGGGAGTFAYAQMSGAKSWVNTKPPPHNRAQTGGGGDYNIQDIAQEEERTTHIAPKIKPYPLDQIDEYFVNAFLALSQAESLLKHCLGINANISSDVNKTKLLNAQTDTIKEIKNSIKNITFNIDKLMI
jgi:hypothetical protein